MAVALGCDRCWDRAEWPEQIARVGGCNDPGPAFMSGYSQPLGRKLPSRILLLQTQGTGSLTEPPFLHRSHRLPGRVSRPRRWVTLRWLVAWSERWCAVLVVIPLSLVACSDGGGDTSSSATTSPTSSPSSITTSPAAVTTVAEQPAVDLEALLSRRVPSGFRLTSFDEGDTGPSDLEKAVRDDELPDAREVLTRAGFVAGFQHLWVNSSDDEIILFLYLFRDNAGAVQYRDRTLADIRTGLTADVSAFDAGVPDSAAFEGSDEETAGAVVLFVKGPYVMQIVSSAKQGEDVVARITPLAKEQYSRL